MCFFSVDCFQGVSMGHYNNIFIFSVMNTLLLKKNVSLITCKSLLASILLGYWYFMTQYFCGVCFLNPRSLYNFFNYAMPGTCLAQTSVTSLSAQLICLQLVHIKYAQILLMGNSKNVCLCKN